MYILCEKIVINYVQNIFSEKKNIFKWHHLDYNGYCLVFLDFLDLQNCMLKKLNLF